MATRLQLKVEKRDLLSRQVKRLRNEGLLPGNVYGQKVPSLAVKLSLKEFFPVYREVGETGLIDLQVAGEKEVRPVLIHNVQLDPVSDQAVHVDFHQVNLTEKIKAAIPVEITGESPAMAQKIGVLVRLLDEIEVEALPADLPENIEVNVSALKEVGDGIKIADLPALPKVVFCPDAETLVVKIEPPAKEEVEEAPVAAEGEAAPAEGEAAPAEEKGEPASEEKSA